MSPDKSRPVQNCAYRGDGLSLNLTEATIPVHLQCSIPLHETGTHGCVYKSPLGNQCLTPSCPHHVDYLPPSSDATIYDCTYPGELPLDHLLPQGQDLYHCAWPPREQGYAMGRVLWGAGGLQCYSSSCPNNAQRIKLIEEARRLAEAQTSAQSQPQ